MSKILLGSATALAVLLAGCGGGGGAAATGSSTQNVSISVVDGAIKNAVVCLDKNSNGACDTGEPTGTTDAAGSVTLAIETADVGKYPIIALVGTNAIDADTGPVTTAYIMKTPADQYTVVSPLTTLVQTHIESTGASTTVATAFVKEQTGLNVSPLADYTKTGGADSALAGVLAQATIVTFQQQIVALASAVGQPDMNGTAMTQTDINKAIAKALLGLMPSLAAAANEASGSANKAALLLAAAQSMVQNQTGLSTTNIGALVAVLKTPKDTIGETPVAGVSMSMLRWTDANNWYYRLFAGTAADNTVDGTGMRHFYEEHRQNSAGVATTWSFGQTPARKNDVHWNGTAWVTCTLGQRYTVTPVDASGNFAYNYCDGWEKGASVRYPLDLSGKKMSDITTIVRAFPGFDSGYAYSSWGPDNLAALGTATFPSGAKLFYQENHPLSNAESYDVTNKPSVFSAAVAAGGNSVDSPACWIGPFTTAFPTNLEELVARNPGTPCVSPQVTDGNGTSVSPNEGWGGTSLGISVVANGISGQSGYYTTNALFRLGFAAGNVVKFYSCLQRKSDFSIRNCTLKGTGTYSITTMGDARVLSFTNVPVFAQVGNNQPLFVERGGSIYYGYKRNSSLVITARMNLDATNAIFTQLGIPTFTPN